MAEKRYDRGELRKPVKMPNGWLRVDGLFTRTGVFTYRNNDGTERRELRLDEEVFAPASLESFQLVPVTDEHPPVFLDASNTKEFVAGMVGESVRKDGTFVVGPMLITDGELVRKLEQRDVAEISCGYTCDLEQKAGEHNGEKYDCIQRNIRGNHVAIVPRGRAGPGARVRMDAAAAAVIPTHDAGGASGGSPENSQREAPVAHKVRVDGIDVEVTHEHGAQLIERTHKAHADALEKKDAKIAELEKEKATLQAKADAEAEKVKKLDAELKAAPEKFRGEIKARMDLEQQARGILGKEAKLDGLTDRQVKEKVLAKTSPELKLDGKADAYVDARFDLALEAHEDGEDEEHGDAIDDARRNVDGFPPDDEDEDEGEGKKTDSVSAYEAMKKRHREAYKQGQK